MLLRNEGSGRFRDVSATTGIDRDRGAGLGVVCEDLDGDGWIDIYVANDGDANNLWINQGDGTFRDDAVIVGAAYNLHAVPEAGMGVVAADLDNDGALDLFVTHLTGESNTLYRGAGSRFVDVTGPRGLAAVSMPWTGFGTVAIDLDLDGALDLLVANGAVRRHGRGGGGRWNCYAQPNQALRNDGRGSFAPFGDELRSWTDPTEISRALACGDVDGDGDLDLLLANIEGSARLDRNDGPRDGHWIVLRCVDHRLRRDALGAQVTVTAGGRSWLRTISSGFSYLSSSEPCAHVGLGGRSGVDDIVVRWPDGLRERFGPRSANEVVQLARGTGEVVR